MINISYIKLLQLSKNSGYNTDFIQGYMKRNNLLIKDFTFNKSMLDIILKKYNKKISDFIRDTYSQKEQKNKFAQISKILNPKKDAPHYYTPNHLAYDLAQWVNNFSTSDVTISPQFFMGENVQINCVGSLYGNGQVGIHKGKDIYKINIHPKYAACSAIEVHTDGSNNLMMIYKGSKVIDRNVNGKFGLAQDKKTKIIWYGFIEPLSNGKYNILDKSQCTGKTIGKLAENIQLSWSTEIKASYYPTIYNI